MHNKVKKKETTVSSSSTYPPEYHLCIWGVEHHLHFCNFVAAEFCTCSISHIGLKTPEVTAGVTQSEVSATCIVDRVFTASMDVRLGKMCNVEPYNERCLVKTLWVMWNNL